MFEEEMLLIFRHVIWMPSAGKGLGARFCLLSHEAAGNEIAEVRRKRAEVASFPEWLDVLFEERDSSQHTEFYKPQRTFRPALCRL